MKNPRSQYLWLFLLSGLIVVIDQTTKYLVRSHLAPGAVWSPWSWLLPYGRVLRTQNSGMAFSMLSGFGWIFMIFAIVVSAGIIYYYPRLAGQGWVIRSGMILMLGGAVGNLIDRLFIGQVTDFISLSTFAVFNVADACIDTGVVVLLLGVNLMDRRKKSKSSAIQ
jgi:signal peptidase II